MTTTRYLCARCDGELTPADWDAGECTVCALPLPQSTPIRALLRAALNLRTYAADAQP